MRFVRGGELFQYIRKAQRLPEDTTKIYIAQLCLAIGYLHAKDIVYRDLKPENILIAEDGYLCLTDFGLAKILENGE